jgi:hypothetical protein
MHKNIPVVDMEILSDTGRIVKTYNLQTPERLPLGVHTKDGLSRKEMDDWWSGRSIPASRYGLDDALQSIGISSPTLLLEKCYGLSLSDQYWVCPKDAKIDWKDVDFFANDFSADMGEVLFGHEPAHPDRVSFMSPDNTSDGWLRKKWIVSDGKRILVKGGSGVYQQEPFSEVVASAVMRRLNIPHVHYSLTFIGRKPYSLCENFVTPETELIPAWRILQTQKRPNDRSLWEHFLFCCEALGIPDVKEALYRMLTVDYIIANEDRHWNNFGCVRSADSLSYLGLAPIYDSGTSLWHNTQRVGSRTGSKPFRKDHAEQIKLVSDLDWFDENALNGLETEIQEIYSKSDEVDKTRRAAIAKTVAERAVQVKQMRRERKPSILTALNANQRVIDKAPSDKPRKKNEHDR